MPIDAAEETESFFISEEEAGERLDKVLSKRFASAGSRTYFQYLIEEGNVLLNGEPVKKRIKPIVGDEVEVEFMLTPELDLTPQNIPLDILYEDNDLLVVNKPVGLVVHPAPGNWDGTFVNALLFHCQEAMASMLDGSSSTIRPGIIHRLDKDTSGLLVAAKTARAQQKLVEMFAGRHIYKEYLAICVGNPGEGEIKAPIGRHPVQRKMMAVSEEKGKPALTRYSTLASDGTLSIVSIVIETGRTHQIRVHMKHHGTPVLGDSLYGSVRQNTKFGVARQLLHAYRLRFEHPVSAELLEFMAPLPFDIQTVVDKIEKR